MNVGMAVSATGQQPEAVLIKARRDRAWDHAASVGRMTTPTGRLVALGMPEHTEVTFSQAGDLDGRHHFHLFLRADILYKTLGAGHAPVKRCRIVDSQGASRCGLLGGVGLACRRGCVG